MSIKNFVAPQAVAVAAIAAAMSLGTVAQGTAQTNPPAGQEKSAQSGNVFKDGWITMKIHSAFIPEQPLEGSNIDVDTTNGVVTLKGTVPTDAAKGRAVALAKATDGVKSVTDQLRVAPSDSKPGVARETAGKAGRSVNDGWIKSTIYAQFLTDWNTLEDSDIDVDVSKGVVTLKGTVKTEAAKTRAAAIAKGTDGVASVNDNLRVVK
jgi:hyperosmotically inducible protein